MNYTCYSPSRLFRYNPTTGRWDPTEHNKFPEWKNRVLCETFKPDERGISRWIRIEDLKRLYPDGASSFGGNGSNFFTRTSPMCEFSIEGQSSGKGYTARRTIGLNHSATPDTARSIKPEILRFIRSRPCALTGSTSGIECDHRSGRYPPSVDKDTQVAEEFQPLSKCVNAIKRNACKRCIETRSRFDARSLGSPIGWIVGNDRSSSCEGCFWYNPKAFFELIQPPHPTPNPHEEEDQDPSPNRQGD
jgi:hypothetical protein